MPDSQQSQDEASQPPQKVLVDTDGAKKQQREEPGVRRVLVVEDSTPLRRMLAKIMESQLEFQVEEAENGQQALRVLKLHGAAHFDLLVVDLMMPVMDGVHFIAEARKTYGQELPPVLICSSRSDRETINLVMKLGVSGYVLKPFKTETVTGKVRAVLAADGNTDRNGNGTGET